MSGELSYKTHIGHSVVVVDEHGMEIGRVPIGFACTRGPVEHRVPRLRT
jgi:hypothetical protein